MRAGEDHPDEQQQRVRREIELEASREEVWEALVTEEGRERWLGEDLDRDIHIETARHAERLVWWWAADDAPATRVDFELVELPRGTRLIVIEDAPAMPLAAMAASFQLVAA